MPRPPRLTPFHRRLERLKGRYHGAIAAALAQRPRQSSKAIALTVLGEHVAVKAQDADGWSGVWDAFRRATDEFFNLAMELGVDEAETHLRRETPPALVERLREAVRDRLVAFGRVVDTHLRVDVEAGDYEASPDDLAADTDAQESLDAELDRRLGRYADALHPVAYEGLASTTFDAGVLMVWQVDPGADNCADCIDLEADNPYCAPEDEIDGAMPLPTYPGDGDTDCRSNCHCSLAFEETSWNNYVAANGLAA